MGLGAIAKLPHPNLNLNDANHKPNPILNLNCIINLNLDSKPGA